MDMRLCFRITGLGLTFATSMAVGAACKYRNENHCSFLKGDETCAERYGTERAFCATDCVDSPDDDGCVAERPDDDSCYAPCGEDKTFEQCDDGVAEDSSSSVSVGPTTQPTGEVESSGDPTTQGSMSASMSASDSDGTASTGPSGCASSEDCPDAASPVCVDLQCVPCTEAGDGDAACAAKDPGMPACRDDGQCVQCTSANPSACADETPVCDGPSSSCVGCTYHEQCPDSACRIGTGECFEPAEVYDVGAGQTYPTIAAAHTDLGDGAQVVLLLHDGADFNETLVLDGAGTAYAFLAAAGTEPQWVNTSENLPTLQVTGDAEAYVQDIRMTGNLSDVGVAVDGASVWLDRTQVVQNAGGGIVLTAAASATVRNCFVGGDVNDIAAVAVTGSTVDIRYSTLGAGFGAAAALRCDGPSTVHVRDALLVARTDDPELDCTTDTLETTATEASLGTDMNTNWFAGFATGDFHLTGNAPGAILTTAEWNTGDPAADIDGTARPNLDGTADVAGADIP